MTFHPILAGGSSTLTSESILSLNISSSNLVQIVAEDDEVLETSLDLSGADSILPIGISRL